MPEATPDLVPCPTCGAANPPEAGWCGQCLRRFDGATSSVAALEHASAPSMGPGGSASPSASSEPPAVHRDGEVLLWRCPACDASNPIEASVCGRCGSAFAMFLRDPVPSRPPVAAGSAIAINCILPGTGLWRFGRRGDGVARAILYVWTVGLSVLFLVRPPSSGGGAVRAVGAVFALAAASVWLVSLMETMRLADGDERPMLPNGTLTWFSAGLTGVLFLGLIAAAMSGRG
jgi:ribosomal protein L40E